MTRKEAKIRLQMFLTNHCSACRYGDKKCTQDCEFEQAVNMAIKALSADRPSGEWTYLYGSIGSYMTMSCPFCGETFNDVAEWKYNYCPNCGERMKVVDKE